MTVDTTATTPGVKRRKTKTTPPSSPTPMPPDNTAETVSAQLAAWGVAVDDDPAVETKPIQQKTGKSSVWIEPDWWKRMMYHLGNQTPVCLSGPPGTGKTTAAMKAAIELGLTPYVIQGHGFTEPEELRGTHALRADDKGNIVTGWDYGVVVRSLMDPEGMLIIDQIDAFRDGVQFMLYSLTDDHRRIDIPQTGETFKVHDKWQFIATMNPNCRGTQQLSEPLIDRLIIVECPPLHERDELKVLIARYPSLPKTVARKIIEVTKVVRSTRKNDHHEFDMSLRTMFHMAEDWHFTQDLYATFTAIVLPKVGDPETANVTRQPIIDAVKVIFSASGDANDLL